jgi:hypothetical protein
MAKFRRNARSYIDEITRYYITVGQLEKQLESSKESDDIEAEISKAIENAQSYLKAIKYKAKSSPSNHRRPNLRMNDQVLRVFNGFYKQIYSQPKLF